ncbi:hypothetical protein [Helicobacter sp. 11S02596-1]|uniref:hypothetical protein n=1 Tax=Helicobacter sp. 11S02596-1 TaxID=1476194 RepID=UPI000BA56B3E|nr:hypothetical protein [Helicobacter sp. 11S02596-1]PAF43539.1 hypothetical protein BJI48_04590 [Helicobacter sp. 11S02596-1]
MKKWFLYGLAIGVLGLSGVSADDLDAEIQKLEKENKLLELKQKQKELQSNQDNAQSNGKQKTKTKAKSKDSKNGFFVGVEGNVSGEKMTMFVYENKDFTNVTAGEATSTFFEGGLVGGYQHYFGQAQRHGIKVSAHLYSGYDSWKFNMFDSTNTISYIPIKLGLDVKYLWDFWQIDVKQTLGLNVGLGYQFDYYAGGKGKGNGWTQNYDGIFTSDFYPVVGLHYYLSRHQFELLYRFGGIFGMSSDKKRIYQKIDESDNYYNRLEAKLLTQSYLTFNYAYRF